MTNKLMKRDETLFPATLDGMMKQANEIAKSGLCPKGINTGAQVLVVALSGREYGLGIMESLRSLYPINGRITMAANLMVALAMRHGHWVEVIETNSKECTMDFFRKERPDKPYRHTFTMADAELAGAKTKDTYRKHPKNMLVAGCQREGCRIQYADILHNVYAPDELVPEDERVDPDDVVKNVFDEKAIRETMQKQMLGWYPKPEDQMKIWAKYQEAKEIGVKFPSDLSNVDYNKYVDWADPVNQDSNIQEGEFKETPDVPKDVHVTVPETEPAPKKVDAPVDESDGVFLEEGDPID